MRSFSLPPLHDLHQCIPVNLVVRRRNVVIRVQEIQQPASNRLLKRCLGLSIFHPVLHIVQVIFCGVADLIDRCEIHILDSTQELLVDIIALSACALPKEIGNSR